MPGPALLLPQPKLGVLAQQEPQGILSSFARDPNYEYGNILPFRKPLAGGPAEWALGYSNALKSMYDAFTAPGRALSGEQMAPEDAMNFALSSGIGGMALGRAPSGSLGMNVYHGSPHKFDAFDMSKVGTGEGAQSYGHGLYFAENPSTASSYKRIGFDNFEVKQTRNGWELSLPGGEKKTFQTLKEADDHMNSVGALYKVDLPDAAIEKMVDWDKPISQQSQSVKDVLRNLGWFKDPDNIQRTFADEAKNVGGISQAVAAQLKDAGIPGIRYLDQGSRVGGHGTSNFVVFDDALPKIIGRE